MIHVPNSSDEHSVDNCNSVILERGFHPSNGNKGSDTKASRHDDNVNEIVVLLSERSCATTDSPKIDNQKLPLLCLAEEIQPFRR